MPPKRLITLRLPPDLVVWADGYASENGWRQNQADTRTRGGVKEGDTGRTGLIQGLLEALREGRLVEHPRAGANPFPVEEREPGSSPSFPALIAIGTPPTVPPQGWFISQVEGVGIYNAVAPEDSPEFEGDISYTLFPQGITKP